MGTICIFLGLILFIGSILGGFKLSDVVYSMIGNTLQAYSRSQITLVIVAVVGVIGLLICLNLVMHGLTYNKVCKVLKRRKRAERP